MYPSRGSNGYGHQQQPYSSQSAFSQNLGSSYPVSSVGGTEGTSQHSGVSRHSVILGGPQEEASGYRGNHSNPSAGPHYGGQYSSLYSSTAQQIPQMGAKGPIPSGLEGRTGFSSSMPDSPKFTSGEYISSASRGYGHKVDQLYSDRITDYAHGDRRQYGERHTTYAGRDLPSEPVGRYADSGSFGRKHQPDLYERMDQASVLRQEQMLKPQSLQTAPLDGNPRQADYVAARSSTLRYATQDHHPAQDPITYGGRIEPEHRSLSILTGTSYGGQPNPSILGSAPQRSMDDYMYTQGSSNPGYGVSLPPGRDYGTRKALRGTSIDADYPSTIPVRGAPRIDDRNNNRVAYPRELERREKDHRRDYLQEREKDREREKERERQRERERERERERRARERERLNAQREKDRERDRKLEIKTKRERTPARISRERTGPFPLVTKEGRSVRRESPHREALHRRHSPIKEKRREYVCKVYSSHLVEVERDYLSLDKRYTRLSISPECSKVVIYWPKGNLKLPLYTPVSFEHDFVEDNNVVEQKYSVSKPSDGQDVKSECGNTVWNSKVILMSGLSQNALEELSSERTYEERIPHFCNMLRFSLVRKNNSLMAIGGPWEAIDGGDPSTDDSSLIQTILRYSKDIAQLDLVKCKHWNRFLEVHYDRVGKDGLFSHKEITVLYVPDLSDCLPSLDLWRDQWLAHKKAIAERENLQKLKNQKLGEKQAGKGVGKETRHEKGLKVDNQLESRKEASSSGPTVDVDKKKLDSGKEKGNAVDTGMEKNEKVENKLEHGSGEAVNTVKEDQGESVLTVDGVKSGKKKIVRRVIKQKVAKKKPDEAGETESNAETLPDQKAVGEKNVDTDTAGQTDVSSANSSVIKTFKRKKFGVLSQKTTPKEDASATPFVKPVSESMPAEDKPICPPEGSSNGVAQDVRVKATVKKKIIRRVPKRKVTSTDKKIDAGSKIDDLKDENMGDTSLQSLGSQNSEHSSKLNDENTENNTDKEKQSALETPEKQDMLLDKKADQTTKTETETNEPKISGNNHHAQPTKRAYMNDDKEIKDRRGREDSKGLSDRELSEKNRIEDPPRRPGFILHTTGSKDLKLQSLSLSLDSLLDYSDEDIDESSFELSLFAESLYEMLQYEMGSRLLAFLQKLRAACVVKRNQRKRQREEDPEKENESKKVAKEDQSVGDVKSSKTEISEKDLSKEVKPTVMEEATPLGSVEHPRKNESVDEDPEEDPEEDEEIPDIVQQHDSAKEVETSKTDAKIIDDIKKEETTEKTPEVNLIPVACGDANAVKEEIKIEQTKAVDKELLQAFRFFDRSRVGYIRVEDMRSIIHSLGKFLSHRDVKELVHTALLESNRGRDDRIFYDKLIKDFDI